MSKIGWLKRSESNKWKALSKKLQENMPESEHKNIGEKYEMANIQAKCIEPIRASIASLMCHPMISLVGNRVQLVCTSAITALVGLFLSRQISEGNVEATISAVLSSAAVLLFTNSFLGSFTAYSYARTKEHLEKNGTVTDSFIEKAVGDTYCIAQGTYLALKDDQVALEKMNKVLKNHPVLKRVLF